MNDERDSSQDRWDEAERILTAPFPAGWEELNRPLSEHGREALIERAMRKRVGSMHERPRGRWRWVVMVGSLAAAAVTLVMLGVEAADSRFELELGAGRSEVRGSREVTSEAIVFSLRNEPGWKVRLTEEDVSQALALYIVTYGADGSLRALDAPIERRGSMFRVRGEVGAMGLRPGLVTLYFVVGPRDAKDDAVVEVKNVVAGGTARPAWHVIAESLEIVE